MILDAKDLIVGRLATVVAKKALLGEEVIIVNADKAIITGKPTVVKAKFKQSRNRTVPLKGPYIHRGADRLLRRKIRGMLPYKQEKGRKAFERIKCYIGIPPEFEGKNFETIEEANVKKLPNTHFTTLGEVSKHLGAKQ
ncbi:50S ribosomal protein L13 [Candidatus Woesearchaeota archaeon]|nr:MAG: 50S ribosomal protein L13 [Candidatus Woesearchaeota archaeon]